MTGTIITNKAIDVFLQYKFVELSIFGKSFYAFRNKCFDMVGYGNHTPVLKESAKEELMEKIHIIAFRATKSECLDLPETTDVIICFELESKAMEVYRSLVNGMIFELESALVELMTLSEAQNFTLSGTMFSLTTSTKASAVAGKKDELYTLLKDTGYSDLVVETVNQSLLSEFVKEQISENNDSLLQWLEGLVNVFEKTSISIRKK